jgi:hypothetical protein
MSDELPRTTSTLSDRARIGNTKSFVARLLAIIPLQSAKAALAKPFQWRSADQIRPTSGTLYLIAKSRLSFPLSFVNTLLICGVALPHYFVGAPTAMLMVSPLTLNLPTTALA